MGIRLGLRQLAAPCRPQPQFAIRPCPEGRRPILGVMTPPRAIHDFAAGGISAALEFLKRTRWELRTLRKAHVWKDRLQIFDVNGDFFEVRGVGFPDADIVPL